jgi:hypothetical protein
VGIRDDEQPMSQVVEHQQRVAQNEHGVGQVEIVVRVRRQPLHVANHVVREKADGAALKARQAGHGDGLKVPQQSSQRFERIAIRQPLGAATASHGDAPVFRRQHRVGIAAEKRIAGPLLAAFDGFEQKRVRPGTQAQIGGQRRVEVGR